MVVLSSLLQFGPLFGFVLLYAITFGILQKSEFFGKAISVNAMVAGIASLIAVTNSDFQFLLFNMVPYFMMIIVFAFFVILMFLLLGLRESDIASAFKDESEAVFVIGVFAVVAVIVVIFRYSSDVLKIEWLKSSYILGLIVFFVIAFFTVKQLGYEYSYPQGWGGSSGDKN